MRPGPANPIDPERPAALRLAALHLRTGALALARTELEIAAGSEALDRPALLDLAEVRWRTGDAAGAGEAAEILIEAGNAPVLAHVIAAEAAAEDGRDSDAGRHVAAALAIEKGSLAPIFAGMEPSPAWPAFRVAEGEPAAPGATPHLPARPAVVVGLIAERLRDSVAGRDAAERGSVEREGTERSSAAGAASGRGGAPSTPLVMPPQPGAPDPYASDEAIEEGPSPAAAHAAAPGVDGPESPGSSNEPLIGDAMELELRGLDLDMSPGPAGEDPATDAIVRARAALVEGHRSDALQLLSLALRLAPVLADQVLDAATGVEGPDADLIRGDAHRAAGRIDEARRAYAAAAAALRR